MDVSAGCLITSCNPTQKEKIQSTVVMVYHYTKINVVDIKSSWNLTS